MTITTNNFKLLKQYIKVQSHFNGGSVLKLYKFSRKHTILKMVDLKFKMVEQYAYESKKFIQTMRTIVL